MRPYVTKKKLHLGSKTWSVVDYVTYIVSQRNRRRRPPPVMGSVCHSGCPTVTTVTTCTTISRVSLGRTPDTTASRSGQSWCPSTAERRWSSSGTSTTPKNTTSGSASPGTETVSVETDKMFFHMYGCVHQPGMFDVLVGWGWTDKTSLGFLNWAPGEPNAAFHPGEVGEESCVEMYHDGHWNDNNCLQKRGFACRHRQCKIS